MIKCKGKDYNGDTCRNNIKDDTNFCKYHYYMKDYTEDMLNNLTYCSGCKKYYYIIEGKICSKCKERGKKNREKNNKEKIICEKEDCIFQRSIENEFCGKHQAEFFKKEAIKSNKKVCYNYIRGCRNKLEINYEKSKCIDCLKKDRLHDKKKRDNINFEIKNYEVNNITDNELENKTNEDIENKTDEEIENKTDNETNNEIDNKIDKLSEKKNITIRNWRKNKYIDDKILDEINIGNCEIKCNKCKKFSDKINFIDKNGIITKKCLECREKARIIDSRRNITEEIIIKRKENAKKPERLETKREWNEENYDKVASYWLDYRAKRIDNEDENYWKNNASCMKAWRDKNPEKVEKINENKKNNIEASFNTYKISAISKNLLFELKKEEFIGMCEKECFYCGDIQEKGFNGIDRIDSRGNYTEDNIVSCCEICNWMKGSFNREVFLKKVEHIMTKNKFIDGELYDKYFNNSKSTNYKHYALNAARRKIEFDLEKKTFLYLIHHNCYLCGKKTDEEHQNGIDRVNNDKGYILENVQPCCGNCNFIKNKFSLETIFDKFKKILIKRKFEVNNIEFIPKIIKKERIDKFFQKNINNFQSDNETESDDSLIDTNEEIIRKNVNKNIEILETNNREKEKIRKQKYREKKTDNDNGLKHLNKKTPEEKREAERIKKQKQREQLREKYGDEEFRKMRAKEIADCRKKKKDLENNNK